MRNNGTEVWKLSSLRYSVAEVWKEIRPKSEKVNGAGYCGVLKLYLSIQLLFGWQYLIDCQPWTDLFLGVLG